LVKIIQDKNWLDRAAPSYIRRAVELATLFS
jgi:hypothetical protein